MNQQGSAPKAQGVRRVSLARVRWSPRRSRSWCPGAMRAGSGAPEPAPTGWTGFLRWQEVVGQAMAAGGRQAVSPEAPAEIPPALPAPAEHEPAPESPAGEP